MVRKILLQCQSLTYLYTGLGAIYTKYQNSKDDLEIDVLFTGELNVDDFIEKIKLSKYVKNVYCLRDINYRYLLKKINKLKKDFLSKFLLNRFYRFFINNIIKRKIPNLRKYSDVFFSHETEYYLLTFMKEVAPNINFVCYGDGSGLLLGCKTKLINPLREVRKNIFLNEIKADEIIALAPIMEDDSFDAMDVPVSATEPEILFDIIKNDFKIQSSIDHYMKPILEKFLHYENKILLLTTKLEDRRFGMSENEQVNIYLDIVDKYCPDNSLVVLKLHPSSKADIARVLKERCNKNCVFEIIPDELKLYPIEIYSKLIQNLDLAITFLSSSRISISQLYNLKTDDAYDVIQNYPLRGRVNPILETYQETLKRYSTWDRKSIVYKCNIIPEIAKYHEKYCVSTQIPPKKKPRWYNIFKK